VPGREGLRRTLLLVLVLAVVAPTSVTSCGSCDANCGAFDGRTVDAELIERGGATLALRLEGGEEVTVVATGRTEVLDEGDRYRFPLHEEQGSDPPEVALAQPCGCGPYVHHLDGSTVDTGDLADAPNLGLVAAVAAIGFGVAVTAWAVIRHLRGEPL
jgi:hypothetical protein